MKDFSDKIQPEPARQKLFPRDAVSRGTETDAGLKWNKRLENAV